MARVRARSSWSSKGMDLKNLFYKENWKKRNATRFSSKSEKTSCDRRAVINKADQLEGENWCNQIGNKRAAAGSGSGWRGRIRCADEWTDGWMGSWTDGPIDGWTRRRKARGAKDAKTESIQQDALKSIQQVANSVEFQILRYMYMVRMDAMVSMWMQAHKQMTSN